MPFSRDITFGPNDTNHSVTVEIIDDRVVERSELFVVALTTADVGVDIERTQREATIIINDDDSMSSHQSVCLSTDDPFFSPSLPPFLSPISLLSCSGWL